MNSGGMKYHGTKHAAPSRKGATLVELLMVVTIGAIVVLSIGAPYLTGRKFFREGMYKTQAQRDAHLVVRRMASVARSATGYTITQSASSVRVDFNTDCGTIGFEGGPGFNSGQLIESNLCLGQTVTLVDGQRSTVNSFAVTNISSSLFSLALDVAHEADRNETLTTQIFLRN